MITLYTVDRTGFYLQNKNPELLKRILNQPELDDYIANLFPDGVSPHGFRYFLDSRCDAMLSSLELHLEMHRRALYPEKPSRMTSIFCCLTLEEALIFRQNHGQSDFPIYEVVCDESKIHIGDMEVLKHGGSVLILSHHTSLYWSGGDLREFAPNHRPFYEVLVPLPVTIGRQVA
ncbi:hypothetical protein AB2852_004213 [Klebsiella variicola]|nr:DUF2441 domain-containing protein [Klebsiella pneumoniae]HDK7050717.1 hypothetical protein [Klebsiella pneumoniae]HEI9862247.1 hypothetical protein [Klebsiella pneumoniae]